MAPIKNKLSIVLRYLLKPILVILILALLYGLAALILSLISTRPDKVDCEEKKEIYLFTNGMHVDLMIPKKLLDSSRVSRLNAPAATSFVAFGWGDKDFYVKTPTWDDFHLGITLKALFWGSESAMHLTYHTQQRTHWKKLALCEPQFKALTTYIWSSFETNEQGGFHQIPDSGYTSTDTFFEARGSYSIFNTCNNWLNRALKKAKVKTAVWSPFGFGVMRYIRN